MAHARTELEANTVGYSIIAHVSDVVSLGLERQSQLCAQAQQEQETGVFLLSPLSPGPWPRCHQLSDRNVCNCKESHNEATACVGGTVRMLGSGGCVSARDVV